MKHVMITQVKNQKERIYDWLFYHFNEGLDTFIIFDDFSVDETIIEIENFKKDFDANVIVLQTDEKGHDYNTQQCKDSEFYGHDNNLHRRIERSYMRGNNIVKEINPKAYCYFFDVDEFLVTDQEAKISNIVESLFLDNYTQMKIFNFDIKHDYDLKKGLVYQSENYLRWDYSDVSNHPIWKNRCKVIVISGLVNRVDENVHNIVSDPSKSIEIRNYEILRMHHFRIPNLPNSSDIKFVTDNMVKNKMIKYKL